MFNMYDDEGVKVPIVQPYEVKQLSPSAMITNDRAVRQKEESQREHYKFNHEDIPQDAIDEYKKMAKLHVEEPIYHVYQLMSKEVISVIESESIYNCWKIMDEHDLKQIPVIGLNGKLKGLATMTNITKAIIENIDDTHYINHTPIGEITVTGIMTAEPISDIRRVAQVMVQYHLNTIPIVDGETDNIVGILSRADILKAVASNPHYQLLV